MSKTTVLDSSHFRTVNMKDIVNFYEAESCFEAVCLNTFTKLSLTVQYINY